MSGSTFFRPICWDQRSRKYHHGTKNQSLFSSWSLLTRISYFQHFSTIDQPGYWIIWAIDQPLDIVNRSSAIVRYLQPLISLYSRYFQRLNRQPFTVTNESPSPVRAPVPARWRLKRVDLFPIPQWWHGWCRLVFSPRSNCHSLRAKAYNPSLHWFPENFHQLTIVSGKTTGLRNTLTIESHFQGQSF